MKQKYAIIIGGGPAGLTAAYELLDKTDIMPIVLEKDGDLGGLSKTINYKGNRIDIGGHRFFSKHDKIMQWWLNILPLEQIDAHNNQDITYRNKTRTINKFVGELNPGKTDKVMLVRNRLSRIFFLRKFFQYPITLNYETIKKLGFKRTLEIGLSYLKIQLFPIRNESSLEDFFY
jgi:protoporphyrinogen oxidase